MNGSTGHAREAKGDEAKAVAAGESDSAVDDLSGELEAMRVKNGELEQELAAEKNARLASIESTVEAKVEEEFARVKDEFGQLRLDVDTVSRHAYNKLVKLEVLEREIGARKKVERELAEEKNAKLALEARVDSAETRVATLEFDLDVLKSVIGGTITDTVRAMLDEDRAQNQNGQNAMGGFGGGGQNVGGGGQDVGGGGQDVGGGWGGGMGGGGSGGPREWDGGYGGRNDGGWEDQGRMVEHYRRAAGSNAPDAWRSGEQQSLAIRPAQHEARPFRGNRLVGYNRYDFDDDAAVTRGSDGRMLYNGRGE